MPKDPGGDDQRRAKPAGGNAGRSGGASKAGSGDRTTKRSDSGGSATKRAPKASGTAARAKVQSATEPATSTRERRSARPVRQLTAMTGTESPAALPTGIAASLTRLAIGAAVRGRAAVTRTLSELHDDAVRAQVVSSEAEADRIRAADPSALVAVAGGASGLSDSEAVVLGLILDAQDTALDVIELVWASAAAGVKIAEAIVTMAMSMPPLAQVRSGPLADPAERLTSVVARLRARGRRAEVEGVALYEAASARAIAATLDVTRRDIAPQFVPQLTAGVLPDIVRETVPIVLTDLVPIVVEEMVPIVVPNVVNRLVRSSPVQDLSDVVRGRQTPADAAEAGLRRLLGLPRRPGGGADGDSGESGDDIPPPTSTLR